jgi:hypothetical protein
MADTRSMSRSMSMALSLSVRILIGLIVVIPAAAHANGVVLESYTGDRPADAPRLLAPVLEELSRRHFDAGDSVARSYDGSVSRSARGPNGMPPDFSAQVDTGFKAWVSGRMEEAVKILGNLVDTAHANSGELARDPSLRDPLQKALIGLALAYKGIGDLDSMNKTFKELLRSYPDVQVSRATYGPDAWQAFEAARRDLQGVGKGKLKVKLTDETAVVFIDEAYRAVGSTTVELAPGEYRVVAMLNKQPSRSHLVTVRPNAESTVEIDARFDQAIHTAGYAGLVFADESDRDTHEAAYAAKFATQIGANAVAIVGIDQVRGRSAVVGALVSLETGREIRRASIPVEPDPSTDRLKALARFLGGDEPAPGLEVQFSGGAAAGAAGDQAGGGHEEHEPAGPRKPRWGGWRWITAGAAVAGLATGGVLVGLDGRCSKAAPAGMTCNDLYATATPGYISLGAGAVFAGVAIYLFATQDSGNGAYVAPTPGGAVAGYSMDW